MTTQTAQKELLVNKLYRKLALVEMERKLIKVSCNLMEDEVYTVDDAAHELMEIISLIEMERQGIISDIG
ncbi:hypothetical protein ACDX78_21880 [Virgibacillus oceani]